jgi:PST family polysaccharide transporter
MKRKAFRGGVWSGLQRGGARLVSFVVFTLLVRLLAPATFGVIAIAPVFITLVNIFLDQGIGSTIAQRGDLQAGHLDSAFWSDLRMGLVPDACRLRQSGVLTSIW